MFYNKKVCFHCGRPSDPSDYALEIRNRFRIRYFKWFPTVLDGTVMHDKELIWKVACKLLFYWVGVCTEGSHALFIDLYSASFKAVFPACT